MKNILLIIAVFVISLTVFGQSEPMYDSAYWYKSGEASHRERLDSNFDQLDTRVSAVEDSVIDLRTTINNLPSGGGSSTTQFKFIVGTTVNAPTAGVDTLTNSAFLNAHIEAWKTNSNVVTQFYSIPITNDSTANFSKVWATGDSVVIDVTSTSAWITGVLTDTTPISTFSDEYQAYYDVLAVKPHIDTAYRQDTVVRKLVAQGYWADSIDGYYFHATNTLANTLINVKDPTGSVATVVGSPIFVPYQGIKGTNTLDNDYVNFNWNPTDNGTNWTSISAFFGIYSLTNSAVTLHDFGTTTSPAAHMIIKNAGNNFSTHMQNATINANIGASESTGMYIISRESNTLTNSYRNGTLEGTSVSGSSGLCATDLHLCHANGTSSNSSERVIAETIFGAGISDAGQSAITTIIESYNTYLGINQIP